MRIQLSGIAVPFGRLEAAGRQVLPALECVRIQKMTLGNLQETSTKSAGIRFPMPQNGDCIGNAANPNHGIPATANLPQSNSNQPTSFQPAPAHWIFARPVIARVALAARMAPAPVLE